MSTSNSGKSFEELLRQKLDGHEYEYHSSQWAKMQQKLHMHAHAANAAKSALVKKGLATAGKIGGGLVAVGAIAYTILSLSGVVDRSDLGLGDKNKTTSIVVNTTRPGEQKTGGSSTEIIRNDQRLAANESANKNAANNSAGQHAASTRNTELGINTYNTHYGKITTRITHSGTEGRKKSAGDIAGNKKANSGSGNGSHEQGNSTLAGNRDNTSPSSGNNDLSNSTSNNKVRTDNTDERASKDNTSDNKAPDLLVHKDEKGVDAPETKDSAAADQPVTPLNPNDGRYNGQGKDAPFKVQIGITGGFSVVNLTRTSENNTVTSIGLNTIGAYVAMPLNAKITLQVGASFRNQHDWNLHQYTSQVTYALKQDSILTQFAITSGQYIDIPLLVKYTLTRNFVLTGGVKLNWLQSVHGTLSRVSYANKALYNYESREMNAAPVGFRQLDMNANVGMEYRFNRLFTAGGSYQIGVQNSLKSPAIIPGTLRNSYLQIYGAMRIF